MKMSLPPTLDFDCVPTVNPSGRRKKNKIKILYLHERLLFTRDEKVYSQKVNETVFQRPIHLSRQVCEAQLKLEKPNRKRFRS